MNKHRANELLQQASLRAVVVSTQLQMGVVPPTLGEFTQNKFSGGTFSTEVTVNGNLFTFTLNEVPSAVCNQMMQMRPGNMLMSECSGSGEVALSLSYDTLLNTPNTPDKCAGVDVGECGVCDPKTGNVSDDNSKCPVGNCSKKVCECEQRKCHAYGQTHLQSSYDSQLNGYCTTDKFAGAAGTNILFCGGDEKDAISEKYGCCFSLCLIGETMITLADGTCKRLD